MCPIITTDTLFGPENVASMSTPTSQRHKQDYQHTLYKMWHLAYLDKGTFGHSQVQVSQRDIFKICRDNNRIPETGMYLVPKNPKQPLSTSNSALVSKLHRKFLLALWRLTRNVEEYKYCMEEMIAQEQKP